MTPEEKAALQQAVANIVQAFGLVRSALTNFSVQLAEIDTPPVAAVRSQMRIYENVCENCGETTEDGFDYCTPQCFEELVIAREEAAAGSNEEPCPPFCDEHETCREEAQLHSASRFGFAWTREQQALREDLLNSPSPEYTVIVERAETPEGSGDRARIPVMGLSEWITRDDGHGWYFDPYTWAKQAIAEYLGVSRNDFEVHVLRPEPPAPVKDRRPVYADPHANPEDDVIRRITRLEDEPELNTTGYVTLRRTVTDNGHGVIWSGSVPQPRHPQDIGLAQAQDTLTRLFYGAAVPGGE